jgi:hypothetical protein
MEDQDKTASLFKLLLVWFGTTFGTITLNQWVLGATLVYTVLQIMLSVKKLFRGDNSGTRF